LWWISRSIKLGGGFVVGIDVTCTLLGFLHVECRLVGTYGIFNTKALEELLGWVIGSWLW
jgi:hypothetical protein